MTIALAKTVEFVASIANAAEWKVVTDGVTNGTTTLTSATAQFVTADQGKTITVTGAGVAGVTLLTTIASVTNATTIIMSVAATSTATAHVVSFGGRSTDARHPEPEIIEAVLEADAEECRELLADPTNPRHDAFTETVTVLTSGSSLPSRTGAISRVEIQHTDAVWRMGQLAPLFKILRWNQDSTTFPPSTSVTDGFYDISTGNIHYTGVSGRVSAVNFVKTNVPQAPDESQSNVVVRALRILFLKEGDDVNAAGLLDKIGMAGLEKAGHTGSGRN